MKRLLMVVVVLLMFAMVVACDENAPVATPEPPTPPAPTATPEQTPEPETTPEPTPEPEPEPLILNDLGINVSQIIDAITESTEVRNVRTFPINDSKQVTEAIVGRGGPFRKVFIYNDVNTEYASTVVIAIDSSTTSGATRLARDAYSLVHDIVPNELWEIGRITSGSEIYGDFLVFVLSTEHYADFDFGSLVFPTSEKAVTDFFAFEENRILTRSLARSGEFQELYNLVMAHIESGNVQQYDTAWLIIDELTPKIEVLDQVTIIYDAFDDIATIFAQGLTDISRENNFVPFTTSTSNGIRLQLGFYNNGWIFMERARIRLENGNTETINMNYTDVNRTVVSGRTIRESFNISLTGSRLDNLLDSHALEIRFESGSRNDGQLDVSLSQLEQDSMALVYTFAYTNFYSDIVSDFERN